MPPKPEKNPLENIDLDFTKPKDKLEDLHVKIEAAERGIALANKLNDMERLGDLMAKLQGFKETEKILLAEKKGEPKQEFWAEDILGHMSADDRKLDRKEKGLI